MSAQIDISTYAAGLPDDQGHSSLSANISDSGPGMIEIRLRARGTTSTMKLTRSEAGVFSMMLGQLSEATDGTDEASSVTDRLVTAGGSITRDELIQMLISLPRNTEIDVQIGTEHVAISGVVPWGRKNWAALQCHRPDFVDLLEAWRLPADIHEQILDGTR